MYDELTKVDIQKMQDEIDYRTRVLRPQLIEEVKVARGFGDLSENAEYDAAKAKEAEVYGNIGRIEQILRTATFVTTAPRPPTWCPWATSCAFWIWNTTRRMNTPSSASPRPIP